MKNLKLTLSLLAEAKQRALGGSCGMDDDEIIEVANKLDAIDCGLDESALRKEVEKFSQLPPEKMAEIAEAFIERKLYEESICRRYGITRATMYRWMDKGKLPHQFRHDGEGKKFLFASECDEAVSKYDK